MSHSWIWLAVPAAALQPVRTAAQKRMTERLSTLTTTYVRSLLGLPVMLAWVAVLLAPGSGPRTGRLSASSTLRSRCRTATAGPLPLRSMLCVRRARMLL